MQKAAFLLMVISLAISATVYGQNISGTVYDAKYDRPLAHANIFILDTDRGTSSDENGLFEIENIKQGKYTLRVSLIGYLDYEMEITVATDGIRDINIYLQPTNIGLSNNIAITARREATSNFASPEAITILNSEILKQESARTVPEALQGATGIFVQKTNHGGGSPFIRGLTGNQNLMMIDGIRLNNTTYRYGPNQYLSTIDPQIIQNIEVVRDAGSVLYGSDAMGGVINVISKNPEYSSEGLKLGGSILGKYMNHDMQKTGSATLQVSNEKIALSGGFTYNDFGDIVGGDTTGKQTPTGYTQNSGHAKMRVKISKSMELIVAYQYDKQNDVPRYDKIIDNYQKYNFDPQKRQLGYARLKTNFANKWFKQVALTGSFNQSDETRIKQKKGSSKVTSEHDVVNTYGASIEIISKPKNYWNFVSGIEYYFDRVNSQTTDTENGISNQKRGYYPDGATAMSLAIYSSHTIDLKKFTFVLGARFNLNNLTATDDTFEDVNVSPNAVVASGSVVYHLTQNHNLIASVYSAFRAPNINDLSSFGSFNAGIEIPNPYLKPEKSLNAELGYKLRYDKLSGSIFLYRSQLSDLISRVKTSLNGQDSLDGEKIYTKENFAKSYIRGFETEFYYEIIRGFSIYGNLTYTYGENTTAEEPMRRIPPLNGKIGLYYSSASGFWGRMEWMAAGRQDRLASGDIDDSRIPDGGTPGWNIWNLRGGYTWREIEITAGINNTFNVDYRTHGSGVNGYGRSVWVMLKIGF